jgi:rhodanese-related sulfurtransferase
MNYFAHRLAHETDAADVAAALHTGAFTLIDARSERAYDDAHLPGALCLARTRELPPGPLVVYCWGPGCNGATKACARLYDQGRTDVKEMLGGFEYWVREGFPVEGEQAARQQPDLSGLVCSVG